MPSFSRTIEDLFDDGRVLSALSAATEFSSLEISEAINAATPALALVVARRASKPAGAKVLYKIVEDQAAVVRVQDWADSAGYLVGSINSGEADLRGSEMLDRIVGVNRERFVTVVAERGRVKKASVETVLPVVMVAVVSTLAESTSDEASKPLVLTEILADVLADDRRRRGLDASQPGRGSRRVDGATSSDRSSGLSVSGAGETGRHAPIRGRDCAIDVPTIGWMPWAVAACVGVLFAGFFLGQWSAVDTDATFDEPTAPTAGNATSNLANTSAGELSSNELSDELSSGEVRGSGSPSSLSGAASTVTETVSSATDSSSSDTNLDVLDTQIGALVESKPLSYHLRRGEPESVVVISGFVASEEELVALETSLESLDEVRPIVGSVFIAQGDDFETIVNGAVASNPITFAASSAELEESAKPTLDAISAYIRYLERIDAVPSIEVAGHTDGDGEPAANRVLSQERATTVRKYLIDDGVDGRRLSAVGYGESELLVDELTAEDKALNRRIEFRILSG